MATYNVIVTESAERDLDELYADVATHDSPSRADELLVHVMTVVARLQTLPERGTVPPELRELGVRDFHEVFFKPYRIIYRILEPSSRSRSQGQVAILLIVDGRRDLQSVLARRLLTR